MNRNQDRRQRGRQAAPQSANQNSARETHTYTDTPNTEIPGTDRRSAVRAAATAHHCVVMGSWLPVADINSLHFTSFSLRNSIYELSTYTYAMHGRSEYHHCKVYSRMQSSSGSKRAPRARAPASPPAGIKLQNLDQSFLIYTPEQSRAQARGRAMLKQSRDNISRPSRRLAAILGCANISWFVRIFTSRRGDVVQHNKLA